ncbi:Putative disease resistance RPP13-like protein 1 [Apostasia shenzhenica]|uniref:Disease resistance RPP13-like protein 1 n=1 Tax=Apostasia shenzhenica TaxID=1088818 RepID=A0A2I0BDM9_9ASPA|nr:Putative disease resistance RPP13-like protein 1 [Apostasia shenzhenica]
MFEVLAAQLFAAVRDALEAEAALQKEAKLHSAEELQGTLEVLRNKVYGIRMATFVRNPDIRYRIQLLQDIIYDAEDLLQESQHRNAQLTRLSVDHLRPHGDAHVNWLDGRLLLAFVTRPYQYFFRNVFSNHVIALKLRGLNSRLKALKDQKSELDLNISAAESDDAAAAAVPAGGSKEVYYGGVMRATAAHTDDIVGKKLHSDASFLHAMLTHKSKRDDKENLRIYAIVGPGGIGKTTLANLIVHKCKDDSFVHAWITVSRKFDKFGILKRIMVSLKAENGRWKAGGDLTLLEKDVRDAVKGKKLLVVLDDVWEAMELWNFWLCFLIKSSCSPGSRVVVTTRNWDVADQMLAVYTHPVQPLAKEESWHLLCRYTGASAMETKQIMEDLKPTGLEILQRCYGNPMAIITVGGLLSLQEKRLDAWELFLDKCIQFESRLDLPVGIQRHLYAAFDDLPSSILKQSFVYCSLFPDDHEIPCSDLFELWVAEGFARDEEEAKRWFVLLTQRNMLVPWLKPDFTRMCKIDGLSSSIGGYLMMHSSGLVLDQADRRGRLYTTKTTLRRLSLVNGTAKDVDFLKRQASLRTLLLFNHRQGFPLHRVKLLDKLSCIRVLSLREALTDEMPDSLGSLFRLRYLDLSGNKEMKKLPESIGELSNLQVLRLQACEKLQQLPQSFLKLSQLEYFDAQGTALRGLPSKIGENMSKLRKITPFRLHLGEMATVKDLKQLAELRTLGIEIVGNSVGTQEAITADLINKKRLRELKLTWVGNEAAGDQQVVDELHPSPSIEDLRIRHYHWRSLPNWLELLPNLRMLYLEGCNNFTEMPSSLCRLQNLEHLQFKGASAVRSIGPEFFGDDGSGFPKLKVLRFNDMSNWESWEMKQSSPCALMPCLQILGIYRCPNLKSLPEGLLEGLRFLRHLRIVEASKLELLAVENLSALESLVVLGKNDKLQRVSNLTGLRCLAVPYCLKLRIAAEESFDALEAAKVYKKNNFLPDWLKELSESTDLQKLKPFVINRYYVY